MASPERTGLRVNATFSVAIGPKSHVIGARVIPMPTSPCSSEVYPMRVTHGRRVERVQAMGYGIRRPFEEPSEQ